MTPQEIYAKLTPLFREVFDNPTLVPTATMQAGEVAAWDSLNHINLIVAIETAFGVRFKTAELEALKNVGHLVELIAGKLNVPRPAWDA